LSRGTACRASTRYGIRTTGYENMFTGMITEIGKVKSIIRKGSSARLMVSCSKVKENINLGDSIAVNGVCLSVVEKNSVLIFDVVGNTLNETNLKRLRSGDMVNLEGALKVGDDLSGHMVSGHIDGERVIKANQNTSKGWVLDIAVLPDDEKYLISKGSIAVDGISLTIGEISRSFLRIFLIPHTIENTTLNLKGRGSYVNLEFDMMAKYAEKQGPKSSITKNMLAEKGFI